MATKVSLENNVLKVNVGGFVYPHNANTCSMGFSGASVVITDSGIPNKPSQPTVHIIAFSDFQDGDGTPINTKDTIITYLSDKVGFSGAGGSASSTLTVYKTADQTKTSDTTLALDADVQVELEIGIYSVFTTVFFIAHATPDLKMGHTIPTNGEYSWTTDWDDINQVPYSNVTTIAPAGNGSDPTMLQTNGILNVTEAGIFGLQWSQYTSSIEATTLKKGTNMKITKLD